METTIKSCVVALSCAVLALSAHRAPAMTIQVTKIKCPVGGKLFETNEQMSGTQFGKFLDLQAFGAIASPWPLAKCPSNGFVVFRGKLSTSELKRLEAYVMSPEYRELKDKETNYYLAARLMKQINEPELELAFTLLNATWEADADQYERYATEALAYFQAVLARPPASIELDELHTCRHLVGELQRRLGRFEAAKVMFESLLADPEVADESSIRSLAVQELRLIEDEDSAQHKIEITEN